MLQNAYFLAKIGVDTAENEQHFAEILQIGRHRHARQLPSESAEFPNSSGASRLGPEVPAHRRLVVPGPKMRNPDGVEVRSRSTK